MLLLASIKLMSREGGGFAFYSCPQAQLASFSCAPDARWSAQSACPRATSERTTERTLQLSRDPFSSAFQLVFGTKVVLYKTHGMVTERNGGGICFGVSEAIQRWINCKITCQTRRCAGVSRKSRAVLIDLSTNFRCFD